MLENPQTLHTCRSKKTPQFSPFIAAQHLALFKTSRCLFLEKESLLTFYLYLMSAPQAQQHN